MELDASAVDYALRSIVSTLDSELDRELSNPKGFSVYPHITSTFIALYEEYTD